MARREVGHGGWFWHSGKNSLKKQDLNEPEDGPLKILEKSFLEQKLNNSCRLIIVRKVD
jgi:hypothetical protein